MTGEVEIWTFNGDRVLPEVWQWEVDYDDGTTFKQFGDDGVFHQIREIDQARIAVFRMVSSPFGCPISIAWTEEKKLIHFYRNIILNFGTPDHTEIRLYMFGWEDVRNGSKTIFCIMPDGAIVVVDDERKITVDLV
jgi:hypothetical protein